MLENTKVVSEKDLGIGLQFVVNLPPNKQMILTAGFPLDWDLKQINALVDKLDAAAKRQAMLEDIKAYELAIKNDYRQLDGNRQQLANHINTAQLEFKTRGKQGEFKMSAAQQAGADNFNKTIKMLEDALYEKEMKLKELKEQCR